MKISLRDAGKRYNREWIFRHLSFEFIAGKQYAITGPNGSGKSTLLQVVGGATHHSEGTVTYSDAKAEIKEPYKTISIAAPYLELVEEMTAMELLQFHSRFKKLTIEPVAVLQETGIEKAANKQIRYFSSGMKQRLKLGQAFFSDTPVLLLDEPTTNLDKEGTDLYHRLISQLDPSRLVIISSNDPHEYSFCSEVIDINLYK